LALLGLGSNVGIKLKVHLGVLKTFSFLCALLLCYAGELKEESKTWINELFFQLFYKTIQIAENESSNDISLLQNFMKEIIL